MKDFLPQLRAAPDAVKYDYPGEHSSPQDKIDSKFDKAYSKLVHKAKKEKVWICISLSFQACKLMIYLLRTEVRAVAQGARGGGTSSLGDGARLRGGSPEQVWGCPAGGVT